MTKGGCPLSDKSQGTLTKMLLKLQSAMSMPVKTVPHANFPGTIEARDKAIHVMQSNVRHTHPLPGLFHIGHLMSYLATLKKEKFLKVNHLQAASNKCIAFVRSSGLTFPTCKIKQEALEATIPSEDTKMDSALSSSKGKGKMSGSKFGWLTLAESEHAPKPKKNPGSYIYQFHSDFIPLHLAFIQIPMSTQSLDDALDINKQSPKGAQNINPDREHTPTQSAFLTAFEDSSGHQFPIAADEIDCAIAEVEVAAEHLHFFANNPHFSKELSTEDVAIDNRNCFIFTKAEEALDSVSTEELIQVSNELNCLP
ncbi:hypothetical protein GYMLUDRAFT_65126 [Collybiopsis luxurians FD-317 M1]|uniref:Unplaced genomic scaffold GYMLUscaffold_136, whole genome shotgun sequence n=1 Tax=Collybiopsis luxurians FD-317 M1 TaxID=944289 RepID=A0A0D0BMS3_9AGAR|nr:hypothetical protein GYMLUDRAFT_65126 [Collybiopsis luxurians FD-317 M1]